MKRHGSRLDVSHSFGLAVVWALSLLGLSACSANRPSALRPGTGDVAFRLSWAGISDLDLMVQDPSGECISFYAKKAASGGVLDIDCNGSYESACDLPIENVYWPKSKAPAGEYIVWVQAHSIVPGGTSLPLRLQLLHGKKVFWSGEGELRENDGVFGPYLYRFPGDEAATLFPGPVIPAPCGVYTPFVESPVVGE